MGQHGAPHTAARKLWRGAHRLYLPAPIAQITQCPASCKFISVPYRKDSDVRVFQRVQIKRVTRPLRRMRRHVPRMKFEEAYDNGVGEGVIFYVHGVV